MATVQSTVTTPPPAKPWVKTPLQRIPSIATAIFALVLSGAIIELTPLKGKLGFFLVFVPLITVLQYLVARIRATKKAAQDVLVSSFMWTAAFLVFLPTVSILATTVEIGRAHV